MYQPVQQIDFPALFSTIANLRQAKLQQQVGQLQLADMYEARDRRHQIEAALRNGDLQTYAALDPQGFAKMQAAGLDVAKTRSEIANTQSQIEDRQSQAAQRVADNTIKAQQYVSRMLEANPSAAPQLQQQIDRRAAAGEINHFTLPGRTEQMGTGIEGPPGYTPPTQQEIRTMQAGAGIEDPYAKPQPAVAEFAQLTGRRPGDPNDPTFKHDFDAWDLSRRRAGATSVNVGDKSAATMANRTQWQSDIANGENTLAAIADLKSIANRDQFLTLPGRFKGWRLSQFASIDPSLLSPAEQQYVADKRDFGETLDQAFNSYRHEVTGAGASVGELKMLMESMLNKNLDPVAFEASLKRFERITRRGVEAKKRLLRDNVDLSPEQMDARLANEMDRVAIEERRRDRAARSGAPQPSNSVSADQAASEFDQMQGRP